MEKCQKSKIEQKNPPSTTEFVLCWPSTPWIGLCHALLLRNSVTVHERKTGLPFARECK